MRKPNYGKQRSASGAFSLAVLPGTYQLRVLRSDPGGTAALPTRYEFSVMSFDLSASRVQDLTVQNVFLDVVVVDKAQQVPTGN